VHKIRLEQRLAKRSGRRLTEKVSSGQRGKQA